MTTITPEAAQRACDQANALDPLQDWDLTDVKRVSSMRALALHIMEFDAFRKEVSEAVEAFLAPGNYLGKFNNTLGRFIIPTPVDQVTLLAREMVLADGVIRTGNQEAAIREGCAAVNAAAEHENRLRTALSRRGLEVRPVGEVGND